MGDVSFGDDCSVWFNAVIRGDVNAIRIGHRVNIQDGAVVHCTYKQFPTILGDDVSVGHNAIVHGCTIESQVLIGMGSIVMDGAVVASQSIVAAGSVVTKGTQIPSGSVFAGVPARKIQDLDKTRLEEDIIRTSKHYMKYSEWFK